MKKNILKKKVLVVGGSYDPPHIAHVDIPLKVAKKLDIDKVIFIPTGRSPHKSYKIYSSFDRSRMIEIMLFKQFSIQYCVDNIEIREYKVSYTCNTLKKIKSRYHNKAKLFLLIGSDWAKDFHTWYNFKRILKLCTLVVTIRPGYPIPSDLNWRHIVVETTQHDISSSRLRLLLAQGKYDDLLIKEYIHPDVLEYIKNKNLYRQR